MIMNIIFAICMYPILPLIYFLMKCEVKKGKETFGVTLSNQLKEHIDQQEELRVRQEQITKHYLMEMKRWLWVFAGIPVFAFLTPGFSIPFTIWMMWLLLLIICFNIPYIRANRRMQELKRFSTEYGETQNPVETEAVSFVDLQMAGRIFCVRWYHFLPQLLICILCCIFGYLYLNREDGGIGTMLLVVFTFCTLLFWGAAVWMDHQKSEVISLDSSVNQNYARAKKHLWKNFWCYSVWINTVFVLLLAVAFRIQSYSVAILLSDVILESLVLILLSVQTCRKLVRIRRTYENQRELSTEADDDSHWIWGMLYYNKNDMHTMVEKRGGGFGTTVNMARPVGMGLMILCALTFLAMPFVCGWCVLQEYTPIRLEIEGEYLVAEQLNTDYRIELEDITELSAVTELPKPRNRVNGTGMERLSKGTWYVHDNGNCQLFLNPENHLFLRFEADGRTYYMSAGTDEETQELYELLNNS